MLQAKATHSFSGSLPAWPESYVLLFAGFGSSISQHHSLQLAAQVEALRRYQLGGSVACPTGKSFRSIDEAPVLNSSY